MNIHDQIRYYYDDGWTIPQIIGWLMSDCLYTRPVAWVLIGKALGREQ